MATARAGVQTEVVIHVVGKNPTAGRRRGPGGASCAGCCPHPGRYWATHCSSTICSFARAADGLEPPPRSSPRGAHAHGEHDGLCPGRPGAGCKGCGSVPRPPCRPERPALQEARLSASKAEAKNSKPQARRLVAQAAEVRSAENPRRDHISKGSPRRGALLVRGAGRPAGDEARGPEGLNFNRVGPAGGRAQTISRASSTSPLWLMPTSAVTKVGWPGPTMRRPMAISWGIREPTTGELVGHTAQRRLTTSSASCRSSWGRAAGR
jgi:hypothetical protein